MKQQKVIVVTGASSGIGEATVRLFAQRGWCVVLAARSTEKIKAIAQEIEQAGGEALALTTDVTVYEDLKALVQLTAERFGRIDVLVNNAGRGMVGAVAELDLAQLEQLFRLNLFAPVAALQAVVPLMRQQEGGVIINVSSMIENIAVPFMSAYAASKIALSYMTDAARAELDHANIAVINMLPGSTDTAFYENTAYAGSGGDFDLQKILNRNGEGPYSGSAAPDKVAEAIWQAVEAQPRQQYVSTQERVVGTLVRHVPAALNNIFRIALNRYAPRTNGDEAPASLSHDLQRAAIVAGGVAVATTFLGVQTARHSSH
ncbi:MAG: SDR family NAD(P)-dependent oxidoreductase [Caldilineaceae bacterium]|nr:SDR family NAD(P)-dependent oxidoreductase [Caldilineaceae bacterium]